MNRQAQIARLDDAREASRSRAPDFTAPSSIRARRRIAEMLTAGLPLPQIESLYGYAENEFRFNHKETP